MPYPVIPEYITVHLGAPDAPAENVTVTFPRYIKGVAASEIYPTWNESAIRANVLAQISVALNRVYTEFYRSRGYDFDITNNTQYDQAFSPNKETFENINAIVDDMFNNYIVRRGNVEPLYAQFCDGVRTQCRGLSQWGSQELAQQGRTPYEILQYYYGQDIDLVTNAPVGDSTPSYPGRPLTVGSMGEDVRTIQRELNRIRKNYPAIPAITETNGVFGADTAAAVRAFQRIFNLTQDGIVGKSTWYRIKSIYNGVKSLSEVTSEGLTISEAQRQFPKVLRLGDTGIGVQTIRFYLAFLGFFLPELPPIRITDVFDDELRDAVLAFQSTYGLTVDGVVGRNTWNAIQNVYEQTLYQLPPEYQTFARQIYPGRFLVEGDTGPEVTLLQTQLNRLAQRDSALPSGSRGHLIVEVDGRQAAVREELDSLCALLEECGATDILRADTEEKAEAIWQLRREFSYSLKATGMTKLNEDIVIPRSRLVDLVEFCEAMNRETGLDIACFGHSGDGNIHTNIMVDDYADPEKKALADACVDRLFRWVLEHGGTITGEHGIGLAKAKWFREAVGEGAFHLHELVKSALDPRNLLNPGKMGLP